MSENSDQHRINDEEETPLDGTLVPSHLQAPIEAYERDGEWFIEDPATGEEIPIVPARRAEEPDIAKSSLLSTTKGKLIIGGVAFVVITLLLFALVTPPPTDDPTRLTSHQFEGTINKVLDNLEEGNAEQAQKLAELLEQARPNSDPAHSLVELTRLWPAWKDDFFGSWFQVKQQLNELERTHDSKTLNKFVQKNKTLIDRELLNRQIIDKAIDDYENGDLESAWAAVMNISEESYARKTEASFIKTLQEEFFEELQDQIVESEGRENWTLAYEATQKIIQYFPDKKERFEAKFERFADNMEQTATLEEAREAIAEREFEDTLRILDQIPSGGRYSGDAAELRQRAHASIRIRNAIELYNEGKAEKALTLLETHNDEDTVELREEIRTVTDIHRRAKEAIKKQDYLGAERLWTQLLRLTRKNYYNNEAVRHIQDLPNLRRRKARDIVEKARTEFREHNYLEARKLYKEAIELDPDKEIGTSGLERLRNQGRIAYNRACNTPDPHQALELFNEAIEILSPEDNYYGRAQQRKKEVEKQLKESASPD